MPANLPPNYHRAEQRYREAIASEDKVEALEEMMRIIPKHKSNPPISPLPPSNPSRA